MKNRILLLLFLTAVFSNGCSQSIQEIKKALRTATEEDQIIKACYEILDMDKKNIDSTIVIDLLTHIIDPRRSTSYEYLAQSPYEIRLKALEKITGEKYLYGVDTLNALNVDIYLDWGIRKGIIKDKDEIDVIHPYIIEVQNSKDFIGRILNHDKVTWLSKYSWEVRRTGKWHSGR